MILRIARHTENIQNVTDFYIDILGLERIGGFEHHAGYDGIFVGKQVSDWHLEFTTSAEKPSHYFDEDDIIVFYPSTKAVFEAIIDRIRKRNIETLKAKNPYWNENGILIKDFDKHNVIISPLKINE